MYVGREIVAIDEVSFQLATNYKRIWFLKGQKPKGAFFWSNKKLITFGALTSSHKFFYDFFDSQNSLTFRCFLKSFDCAIAKLSAILRFLDIQACLETAPGNAIITTGRAPARPCLLRILDS